MSRKAAAAATACAQTVGRARTKLLLFGTRPTKLLHPRTKGPVRRAGPT
jgi:hypothetical protein